MWRFAEQHLYTGGDDGDVGAGHVLLFGAGNWRSERRKAAGRGDPSPSRVWRESP